MFLALGIEEVLGVVFGAGVTSLSWWLVYRWAIKPEREVRSEQTWRTIEERHRKHWNQRPVRRQHNEKIQSEVPPKRVETKSNSG